MSGGHDLITPLSRKPSREERDERDRLLLQQAFQGNDGALDRLIDAYLPLLIGFFRYLRLAPEVAEDLTQETFFRMFRGLEGFERDKPFLPWLMAIGRNTFLDWRKSSVREQRKIESMPLPEMPPSVEDTALTRIQVQDVLNSLPPDARFLVEMRILAGLSFAELANLTGESEASLRSKICRILARLRQHLPVPERAKRADQSGGSHSG